MNALEKSVIKKVSSFTDHEVLVVNKYFTYIDKYNKSLMHKHERDEFLTKSDEIISGKLNSIFDVYREHGYDVNENAINLSNSLKLLSIIIHEELVNRFERSINA